MMLRQLFDAESSTYTYLLADLASQKAVLIDPVHEQLERDLRLLDELNLTLAYVLETHVHADHVTSAGLLADRTGAETAAAANGASCVMRPLRDGDILRAGALTIQALATPGHTQDSLSFHVPGHVFTGDALLIRGTGRTDFQSGDAGALFDSITEKLFALSDDTSVWPGHDYRGLTVSTVREEKTHNPRLAGKTREQFVALMQALALAPPRKLQLAVPRNLRCGRESAVEPTIDPWTAR
jgi:sulfur dioxygenase